MFYKLHIEDIEQLKCGAIVFEEDFGAKDIEPMYRLCAKHREEWSMWKVKIEISNSFAITKVKFSAPYTSNIEV